MSDFTHFVEFDGRDGIYVLGLTPEGYYEIVNPNPDEEYKFTASEYWNSTTSRERWEENHRLSAPLCNITHMAVEYHNGEAWPVVRYYDAATHTMWYVNIETMEESGPTPLAFDSFSEWCQCILGLGTNKWELIELDNPSDTD